MTRQADRSPISDEVQFERLQTFFENYPDSSLLFAQAMTQTRMAMCISDPHQHDNPIVFANRAFCALTGYEEEEIVGRNCRFLQGDETTEQSVEGMRKLIDGRTVGVCEVLNYRKDGEKFWSSVHIGPIYNRNGELRFLFGSQWDVTDVVAARIADEQFATVMRELNHRIMNMFAVISAIISLTERNVDSKAKLASLARARIAAFGDAHRASIAVASESRQQDFAELVRKFMQPFGGDDAPYTLEGDDFSIGTDLMMPITMILFELATNSMKFGSLGRHADPANISWTIRKAASEQEKDVLLVKWREPNGSAPDAGDSVVGASSGFRIMEAMAQTVGGHIEVTTGQHFEAVFEIPLSYSAPVLRWNSNAASH